jgi:hypothetical protein
MLKPFWKNIYLRVTICEKTKKRERERKRKREKEKEIYFLGKV